MTERSSDVSVSGFDGRPKGELHVWVLEHHLCTSVYIKTSYITYIMYTLI